MTDVLHALRDSFLRDFTAQLDAEIMRPLSIAEAERIRANGNTVAASATVEGGRSAANTAPPSHSHRWDTTPPRPSDLYSAEERDAEMQRLERVAEAITTLLSMLPASDRGPVVNAVLRGMEAVSG